MKRFYFTFLLLCIFSARAEQPVPGEIDESMTEDGILAELGDELGPGTEEAIENTVLPEEEEPVEVKQAAQSQEETASTDGEVQNEVDAEVEELEKLIHEEGRLAESAESEEDGEIDPELEEMALAQEIDSVEGEASELLPAQMNPPGYRVREFAGQLELKTPWGEFVIPGEFGPEGLAHYKFAIPIDALKENGTPEEPTSYEEGPPRDLAALPPIVIQNEMKEAAAKLDPDKPIKVIIDDSDLLIVEANHLYNRKRYFDALVVVNRALKKDSTNIRAWLMKGSLLHVQGYQDMALKAWEQGRKIKPEDPEILATLEKYGSK